MKKLKLSSLQVSPKDILTREQMKAVYGGSGSGAENKICTCEDGGTAGIASCTDENSQGVNRCELYCQTRSSSRKSCS